ncbi:MAG: hypothetical protein K2Y39_06340 [Candidatus Obscuribacterales bacterium]|nr:hypothetical protein [Candidatus Obscuribacterales bacterium]
MVETFDPAQTGKTGDLKGKDNSVIANVADGQGEENLATKDPSATLYEATRQSGEATQVAGAKAQNGQEAAQAEASSGYSTGDYVLGGALFAAGAIGQKYGFNRQALAMVGRGLEVAKTGLTGEVHLAPYAKFLSRNNEVADPSALAKMHGWLRPGADSIHGNGQLFVQADRTVVATNDLLKPNVFHAVNKYGDAAKFTSSEVGVHSLVQLEGKGAIKGFAVTHETPVLTELASTSMRDGNRFARFMKDGVVLEGKGVFTSAEMEEAIRQGHKLTSSLYESVVKTKKLQA